MIIDGKEVVYNDAFRLFLCSRNRSVTADTELQTRCCMINFLHSKESLVYHFLNVFLDKEKKEQIQDVKVIMSKQREAFEQALDMRIEAAIGFQQKAVSRDGKLAANSCAVWRMKTFSRHVFN